MSDEGKKIKEDIQAIEKAISEIGKTIASLDVKTPARIDEVRKQIQAIDGCREKIRDLEKDATPDEIRKLRNQCLAADQEISLLFLSAPLTQDHRKLFYSEHGQWARHFSTVRMTIMTFTITTCTAIIAWKWWSGFPADGSVIYPVGALWIIGSVTFWSFTYHTYSQVRSQKKFRDLMPDGIHASTTNSGDVKFDWVSLVVPLFSAGMLAIIYRSDLIQGFWPNLAVWLFLVAGVAVPCGITARLTQTALRRWTCLGALGVFILCLLIYGLRNGFETF